MSVQAPPVWTPQQPTSAPEEKSALGKLVLFGIVHLAGIVTGWVVSFYVFGTVFASSAGFKLPPNPTPAQASAALGPIFQAVGLLVPVSLAIELVGMFVLTLGFREFRDVDAHRFSLPTKLMYLMIIGTIIAAAGVIPLFNSLPSIIAQAPYARGTTPSAAFMSGIGTIILFALVAGVGGILALIGVIGGQVLGLWRVGTKYNETVLKLGAIFAIIPLLNVVAPILVLVGAHQVRGRIPGPV